MLRYQERDMTCRRQGLAKQLMDCLETVTERDEGFFVDLFVRESNTSAINMYEKVFLCPGVQGYLMCQEKADLRCSACFMTLCHTGRRLPVASSTATLQHEWCIILFTFVYHIQSAA